MAAATNSAAVRKIVSADLQVMILSLTQIGIGIRESN